MKAKSQKDKLQLLADELNKQKSALLLEVEEKTRGQKQRRSEQSEAFMVQVRGVSHQLDERGRERGALIDENDKLKKTLKQCLDRYEQHEARFNEAVAECGAKAEALAGREDGDLAAMERERARSLTLESSIGQMGKVEVSGRLSVCLPVCV